MLLLIYYGRPWLSEEAGACSPRKAAMHAIVYHKGPLEKWPVSELGQVKYKLSPSRISGFDRK